MVAEWSGVDEHRGVLGGLQQVGFDGVLHDDGHGTCRMEVLGTHRLTAAGVGDDDAPQPGS